MGLAELMREYRGLLGLALLVFLVDGAFVSVSVIGLPVYLPEALGSPDGLPGFTLAAMGFGRLAAQTFSGSVSDRLGTANAGLLGACVIGGAALLMTLTREPAAFPLLGLAWGLGGAVLWPAIFASVVHALPASARGKAAGLLGLTTAATAAVAVVGGSLLSDLVAPRAVLVAALVQVAAALLIARRVLRRLAPASGRSLGSGEARPGPALLFRFLRRRTPLVVALLAQAAALGAVTPAAAPYGTDVVGVELHVFALLLVPAAVIALIAVNAGGLLADRLGRSPVMVGGFVAAAAGSAGLLLLPEPAAVPFSATLAFAGFALAIPALNASMMDAAGTTRTGLLLGWFMIAEGTGQAAGPAIGGTILEFGSPRGVLMLCAGLLVLCALAGIRARTEGPALMQETRAFT